MIRYEFSTGQIITLRCLRDWCHIVARADISFEESTFVLLELEKLRCKIISQQQFLRSAGMPPGVSCTVIENYTEV